MPKITNKTKKPRKPGSNKRFQILKILTYFNKI